SSCHANGLCIPSCRVLERRPPSSATLRSDSRVRSPRRRALVISSAPAIRTVLCSAYVRSQASKGLAAAAIVSSVAAAMAAPCLALLLGDQLLQSCQLTALDLALAQEMIHERGGVALEDALDQILDHGAVYVAFAELRPIDEPASLGRVRDHALLLHLRQHGGDGGEREAALGEQRGVHIRHRGLAALPEHAQDGELKVSELDRVGHGDRSIDYRSSTTTVVVRWARNLSRRICLVRPAGPGAARARCSGPRAC